MPATYSQIYMQVVIVVQGRENLLHKKWRGELFKYMSKIITNKGQKSIIINGVEDHVHLFIGLKPSIALSDLIRSVKASSSNFLNQKKWIRGKFAWQSGYGAFSYSRSQIDSVYQYINNQEKHHQKVTFREEYLTFLKKFEVNYDERYLFDWIE